MDQLLCLEATWHDGYPLSQTVFTSLHVDRLLSPDQDGSYTFHGNAPSPHPLVHKLLRSYCIALIKCCQLALHLIQSQNFYEEEDFVTHLFGRELLPNLGTDAAMKLLNDAMDWLAVSTLPDQLCEALVHHLQFRQGLLQTLADERNQWQHLIHKMESIRANHALAEPIPAAFSEKVQRQLATSTPPRPMLQISWDEACSKWTSLCEHILVAYGLTSHRVVQSPHSLQRAVWAFSYRVCCPRPHPPGCLSRR